MTEELISPKMIVASTTMTVVNWKAVKLPVHYHLPGPPKYALRAVRAGAVDSINRSTDRYRVRNVVPDGSENSALTELSAMYSIADHASRCALSYASRRHI